MSCIRSEIKTEGVASAVVDRRAGKAGINEKNVYQRIPPCVLPKAFPVGEGGSLGFALLRRTARLHEQVKLKRKHA